MKIEDKIRRIKEICNHYESALSKARENRLDISARRMINQVRQDALTEICELVRN